MVEVKEVLMAKTISIAKSNPEFKQAVEAECLKQVRGDYNVAFDRLIEIDQATPILPAKERDAIISLVKQMKDFKPGRMPIIFVPVMETRDPRYKNEYATKRESSERPSAALPANPNNYIIAVDQENDVKKGKKSNALQPMVNGRVYDDTLDCQAAEYYSGYFIDDSGNLTYYACINEAIAWDVDIWIYGYEEDVSPGNQVMSDYDINGPSFASTPNLRQRTDGSMEYVAFFQAISGELNDIENWKFGKLELKVFIASSTGTTIFEQPLGKLRRRNFTDEKWVNVRKPLGHWYTSIWGNVQYERWIEENDGNNINLSTNVTYTANGANYTTSWSVGAKQNDNNLGLSPVLWTDHTIYYVLQDPSNSGQKYSIAHAWFQRRDF